MIRESTIVQIFNCSNRLRKIQIKILKNWICPVPFLLQKVNPKLVYSFLNQLAGTKRRDSENRATTTHGTGRQTEDEHE